MVNQRLQWAVALISALTNLDMVGGLLNVRSNLIILRIKLNFLKAPLSSKMTRIVKLAFQKTSLGLRTRTISP
jgi:hypothetical protein